MPMIPPITESVTASIRNWSMMWRRRAPTAMRRPISRVRSVTDTSMMFMMPMPPTGDRSDRREQVGHHSRGLLLGLENFGQVPEPEVVVLVELQAMALAQQRADLLLDVDHVFPDPNFDRDGLDRTHVGLADPEDFLLGRRERDQDDVVLVLAIGVLALPREEADHREWHLLDPDDLAERVGLPEEVERGRLAEQRNLGGAVLVLGADRAAVRDQIGRAHV